MLLFALPALLLLPVFAEPAVLWLVSSDRAFGTLLAFAYREPQLTAPRVAAAQLDPNAPLALDIDREALRATVDPRFLSVAIDTSQVVGGHWWSKTAEVELKKGRHRTEPFDFEQPHLLALARELAPAYLRIGGTEADLVRYDLSEAGPSKANEGELVLTRGQWDGVNRFARDAGLELFFTVNAAADRDASGAWRGQDARELIAYSKRMEYPVGVFELGNEVNVFWFTHGLSHHIGAERYADDVRRFTRLVRSHYPRARVAAGAAFIWPVMGEPPPRLLPDLMRRAGADLDVVTWHYYPEQSRRCWAATRRAEPGLMLEPKHLDEFGRWAGYVNELRDRNAGQAQVWLGETGGAQCGGEPGISDRFGSSLWWLDQLGSAAAHGQQVVVRQTLAGSHYGMIDEATLQPRPDYFGSVLWKRLMGERVLDVAQAGSSHLRGYAHCTSDRQDLPGGSVSLLLLNTDEKRKRSVALPDWVGERGLLYRVTSPELYGKSAYLNGERLAFSGGELQGLEPQPVELGQGDFELPPASYAFLVLPQAGARACM